jgi:hypothetical protein
MDSPRLVGAVTTLMMKLKAMKGAPRGPRKRKRALTMKGAAAVPRAMLSQSNRRD